MILGKAPEGLKFQVPHCNMLCFSILIFLYLSIKAVIISEIKAHERELT